MHQFFMEKENIDLAPGLKANPEPIVVIGIVSQSRAILGKV